LETITVDDDNDRLERIVRLTQRLKMLDHERLSFAGRDHLDAVVLAHLNTKRRALADELARLREQVTRTE
jgi:hypothetical protein